MAQPHVQKVRLLYKTILRLHRGLPPELQVLGNEYTREEFKRHKNCSPMEAQTFMSTWAGYAIDLAGQLGIRGKPPTGKIGKEIDPELLENMRDEQVAQLYELLKASKGLDESEDLIDTKNPKS
ncbi:succinate dehydrogenase assembly factor 3, mitochondrial [Culicoides brevitarsis]|uniref:succinate dehydrogenase assembly factor 3, mitochondrial n=1 Tax=Culicoides brevitarsis TaxID=469753 RepID=UPI00307B8DE4